MSSPKGNTTCVWFTEARTAGVAVLPDDPAVAARRVDVELLANQVAEAGRVQVGAGADDTVTGEAADLPGNIGQDVH